MDTKFKILSVMFCGLMATSSYSLAQNTSSPLFTTPAERSSTTVPILSGTNGVDSNGIIEDIGGGRKKTNQAAKPKIEENTQEASNVTVEASSEIKSEEFGAWIRECLSAVTSGPRCQITQKVPSPDGKQIVLVFSMAKINQNNQYQVQLAVPLGISVPRGIELQIGDAYSSTLPVARCTVQGCIAEGIAADDMIQAMASGGPAKALVRDTNDNPIPINIQLDGFGEATTALN